MDPTTIRTYKFIHVWLDPTTLIRDVTKSSGANSSCHYTDLDELDSRIAYMLLEELRPTPNITPTGKQDPEPEEN